MNDQSQQTRARAIQRAGLDSQVDEERLARFLAMAPGERVARALQHEINPAEMSRWAARYPNEVPLLNGEYFYIAETLADNETPGGHRVQTTAPSRPTRALCAGAALNQPRAVLSGRTGAREADRGGR
jgi:hypothetical protein